MSGRGSAWIRRRSASFAGAAALGAVLGACRAPVFQCTDDRQCVDGRRVGLCERDGWCSFADASCPTGRAYGALAPDGLARRCTMPIDALGSTGSDDGELAESSSSDDGEPVVPRRAEGDGGEDESSSSDDGASTGELLDACANGIVDGDEADVDCGGDCEPCALCMACGGSVDCVDGASCVGGRCRVFGSFATDWREHCNEDGTFAPSLVVPPGTYRVTATPSAGSKWISDTINGGNTWAWWLDCTEVDFTGLRTPPGQWYADADDAFAALLQPTETVELADGTLSCGVLDNACTDNRGGVEVVVENVCP